MRPMKYIFTGLFLAFFCVSQNSAATEVVTPNQDSPDKYLQVTAEGEETQTLRELANSRAALNSSKPQFTGESLCFENMSTLSPQIRALVTTHCLDLPATSKKSCDCLAGLYKTNKVFRDEYNKQNREESLRPVRRLGYQFLLQQWISRYADNVKAIQLQTENAKVSLAMQETPGSCHPNRILRQLKEKIDGENCQKSSVSKAALKDAISVVLGDIDDPKIDDSVKFAVYISRQENATRFYRSRNKSRDFIDCMPNEVKKAAALLPIIMPSGSIDPSLSTDVVEDRRNKLNDMEGALNEWIKNPGVNADSFVSEQSIGAYLRQLFHIFPSAQVLLGLDGSKSQKKEVLLLLKSFVKKMANVPSSASSADLAHLLGREIKDVQHQFSVLVKEANEENAKLKLPSYRDSIAKTCDVLQKELTAIACEPESFIHDENFMVAAKQDAETRDQVNPAGQKKIYNHFDCSSSDNFQACQHQEAARCMARSEYDVQKDFRNQLKATMDYSALSVAGDADNALNGQNQGLLSSSFFDQSDSATNLALYEESATLMMCSDFNAYAESKCSMHPRGDRTQSQAYRDCAARLSPTDTDYMSWLGPKKESDAAFLSWKELPTALKSTSIVAKTIVKEQREFGRSLARSIASSNSSKVATAVNSAKEIEHVSQSSAPAKFSIPQALKPYSGLPDEVPSVVPATHASSSKTVEPPEGFADKRKIQDLKDKVSELEEKSNAVRGRHEIEKVEADIASSKSEINRLEKEMAERKATVPTKKQLANDVGEVKESSIAANNFIVPASSGQSIANSFSATSVVSGDDITRAAVNTSFGGIGAVRQIQESVPKELLGTSNAPKLVIEGKELPLKDILTVKVSEDQTTEQAILSALEAAQKVEGERVMIEVLTGKTARLHYVQIVDGKVVFLAMPEQQQVAMQIHQMRGRLPSLLERLKGMGSRAPAGNPESARSPN